MDFQDSLAIPGLIPLRKNNPGCTIYTIISVEKAFQVNRYEITEVNLVELIYLIKINKEMIMMNNIGAFVDFYSQKLWM